MDYALLKHIYPAAYETAQQAAADGRIAAQVYRPETESLLVVVERAEFVIAYCYDAQEQRSGLAQELPRVLAPYLGADEARPVYCNIYGRSSQAMQQAQRLGFRLEMHGIKLAYAGQHAPQVSAPGWQMEGCRPGSAPQIAALLDRAYLPLVARMGGQPGDFTRQLAAFTRELADLEASGGVYTFWNAGGLVAVGLARGSYLRDFAVEPARQNLGLGAAALAQILADRQSRGFTPVHLDVAMLNTGGLRFYLRHGFREIGCFADHCLEKT